NLSGLAAAPEGSCEFGSAKYYTICGVTRTDLVPLELVKCRIQLEPEKYKRIVNGYCRAPTLIGDSMHGLCKFGLYKVFKNIYSGVLGEEILLWRTCLYLAASASAEFADNALSPMEACKVRIQTQPGFPNTLREALPKMKVAEGISAFYKGLVPLWLRQIPYTMMKFACFERTVEALYKFVVPKPRAECNKNKQLVVTFVAGYIAGVFCAIVSHPADSVVSLLNKDSGSTPLQALQKLGPKGVWKGLFARILMIGTLTALQWFIYGSVKLQTPPPPEMLESLQQKRNAQ
uniref:Solute carrier family 25 member 3 n=1 Tax=Ciona savignyi TaxID=51511 RepID=H2Z2D6_CIOSA